MAKDPMAVFVYALKAPESKRQYPRRFKMFLDYLQIPGNLDEQAKEFVLRAKKNSSWMQDSFMRFVIYQIERAKRGEIQESTISNYYKATKLFCEMNELSINWKKISRETMVARMRKFQTQVIGILIKQKEDHRFILRNL